MNDPLPNQRRWRRVVLHWVHARATSGPRWWTGSGLTRPRSVTKAESGWRRESTAWGRATPPAPCSCPSTAKTTANETKVCVRWERRWGDRERCEFRAVGRAELLGLRYTGLSDRMADVGGACRMLRGWNGPDLLLHRERKLIREDFRSEFRVGFSLRLRLPNIHCKRRVNFNLVIRNRGKTLFTKL